ncbi:RsbT co-antagonist protein RsbRA [Lentibacillus sediminis]|uniref:RsbT co-antagonist protein RsbRA n=1 Tax=Lentibacillus sediminis TaxID=1940529 RepID=UPI000C1BC988|nr:RsbT co-antagonist protein RsbRA [Lentibacillus sediminis]
MDGKLKEIVLENSDVIVQKWLEEINSDKEKSNIKSIPDELFETTNREFVNVIFRSIKNNMEPASVENFAEKVINLGWPLSYITDGLQVFRRVMVNYIVNQPAEQRDIADFTEVMKSVDDWLDPIIRQLVDEYTGSWEQTVSMQKVALQELSAPIIPLVDNITAMPLVGTIDTERAKLIMENLLDGVINHNSQVVLIDITGVPIVDTMVAHHIIKAAEAVRLVGATCILVGIRPEIAQTIVNLGIDLSKFPTQSTMEKGFRRALELTDRKIVEFDRKDENVENLIHSIKGE